jgi:hypothetical protein
MRNIAGRSLFFAALAVVLGASCFAQGNLAVRESATRFQFLPNETIVDLPVENLTQTKISARILLELLDPKGAVQGRAEQSSSLNPGLIKLKISLPVIHQQKGNTKEEELLWYRLRYTITTSSEEGPASATVTGIISVGEASPGIFELHAAMPRDVDPGETYLVRVRAVHPTTGRPVSGVSVHASADIETEDGKPVVTETAVTDGRGFVTLHISLPKKIDEEKIGITVEGERGVLSSTEDEDLHVMDNRRISLSTDKALYQPGQTVHIRMMVFDGKKKAIEEGMVAIEIHDPDQTLIYRTEVTTSKFGIASADWQVLENQKLGMYNARAIFSNSQSDRFSGWARIKISRYELPTFSVNVKPNQAYYLPEQNATVEVRADYLFGEPVRNGHVKVVRETDRRWNYKDQKWEVDEGAEYEGEADNQGRFVAHIDLSDEQNELGDEDYRRFRDIRYAAFFTDSSTGRTEQRRFDLRLTKDPIHIYLSPAYSRELKGLPLELFVVTDYADGRPAECDVDVNVVLEHRTGWIADAKSSLEQFLKRVHTNRYGVAMISGLNLPSDVKFDDIALSFRARDRKGANGHRTEEINRTDEVAIRVSTDKTLYRPEEPIQVILETNGGDFTAFVEARDGSQALESKVIRFLHGRAVATFGPSDKFQNEVTIVAYAVGSKPGTDSYYSIPYGAHSVLFPKNHQLELNVKLEKTTYRPGDEASGSVQVHGPDGGSVRGALGLVVIDKAVDERERADIDFGRGGGFYSFLDDFDSTDRLSGVRRVDLDRLDLSKPLPDGLELVAQFLLQRNSFDLTAFGGGSGEADLHKLFATEIDSQLRPIQKALGIRYSEKNEYPKTRPELDRFLEYAGIKLDATHDPWGQPFRARFSVENEVDKLEIVSSGPDKQFGTEDDFVVLMMKWPYFKKYSDAITHAVRAFHERTGGYIRDAQTLKPELSRDGVDMDSLSDPWGHPYQFSFDIDKNAFLIIVKSAGRDGRFHSDALPSHDDFTLATIGIDSFSDARVQIEHALVRHFELAQEFPEDFDQFKSILQSDGIDWDKLRDAWGQPYKVEFKNDFHYADNMTIESYAEHVEGEVQRRRLLPVSQKVAWVIIKSEGKEEKAGTRETIVVASFSRTLTEQSSKDRGPIPAKNQMVLAGGTGAISGSVIDPDGKAIVGALVMARSVETGVTFEMRTDNAGGFILRDLSPGLYVAQISATNFKTALITSVPVVAGSITMLDQKLVIGTSLVTVSVDAGGIQVLETQNTSVVNVIPATSSPQVSREISTPRLREYFPETLYWQPELITDANGRARLKFPLADSITTWKLSAVASTLNGEIGTAEKEFRAFQPFFVEHDPPRYLTVGDEVSLPVILRNYLEHPLQMTVEMKPENWFTLLSPATLPASVSPRNPAREIFHFRATAPTKFAKQQVTARGADASDAISRTITVRPNGEEKTQTISQVFDETALLDVRIPEVSIPGSLESHLKIYPNLAAHVLESIEAILERPYGCGEQTISSTYPSILLLKYTKGSNQAKSPIVGRAHHYMELGYQRLLSYRAEGGGFTYWGHGDADVALTAYAVRFLSEAKEFVAVDEDVISAAEQWLLKQQQEDGRWIAHDWRGNELSLRSAMLTAYIARTFSELARVMEHKDAKDPLPKLISGSVARALNYVEPQTKSVDEPYLIAMFALTAMETGDASRATGSLERLRKMERQEGDTSYWSLETNTPFYGWGLAGRIETTALVLQAIVKGSRTETLESKNLISRGLLFLLRNQDRYGIWYSTQATVNVLETMGTLTSQRVRSTAGAGNVSTTGSKAVIFVDGKEALSVDLPAAGILAGPTDVDLSSFVAAGNHRIEIRRPAGASPASVQFVADYYVPWTRPTEESDFHHEQKASDALRLRVNFDKETAQVGETIHCNVEAERIGFRGYGMLLAEIGLPPGAEVDRASLEAAMEGAGWQIDQYDVLPDRLIVYLWPRAGGTKFSFAFKLRYGIVALSAPSVLYDYYNPEARALVGPTRFTIH